ncbi:uncharacterized protein P174DRAFT_370581 [Aspergillus novofumigatus IBT 16806]|uniref:Uncharacterized protein n=1 Tax=Aspergillus novofumigatus (strain IBT 16806) TaxID=1392255 RepID=A0A2I1C8P4_ASPN1|nr:uncharacterized protein P174DRAFT_370581 [Aspergillus novofumigatus IBT 16806]PKX93961.1 hypothetical protein P174DRAFT_370581 [Aspergillus novofumigatus IBT 16806]
MARMTTKEMWETIKQYFGDGHVLGSAPLRYNMHICEMKRPSTSANAAEPDKNGSARYGVEISEHAMPLYSVYTCPPPCTCFDMAAVVKRIDEYLETAPDSHPDDFTITSGKNDTDAEEVNLYIMRDVLSWWVHWGGALRPGDYWKQIYVAFAAIPNDVQIPPNAFMDGSYRYLGHTWDDCRQGLLEEGMPPTEVEFVEMCLWRQMLTQYFEKVDPEVYRLLKAKITLMTQCKRATRLGVRR